jgi:hypothetical protein
MAVSFGTHLTHIGRAEMLSVIQGILTCACSEKSMEFLHCLLVNFRDYWVSSKSHSLFIKSARRIRL